MRPDSQKEVPIMAEENNDLDGGTDTESPLRRSLPGFVVGLAFGALVGAGVALLYAPNRGEKTRRRLRKRLREFEEGAVNGFGRAGASTRRELARRRRQLQAGVNRVASKAKETF
jgi:gas vesicle protein